MKKSLLLFSSVFLLAAGLVYAPQFVNGSSPQAELKLAGKRTGDKFELVNTGEDSIFYDGYSRTSCILSASFADPKLIMPGVGWCGTGMTTHRLDRGKSVILDRCYLPEEAFQGKAIVVSCIVSGRKSGWEQLKNFSAEKIPAMGRFWTTTHAPHISVTSPKFIAKKPVPVATATAP